MQQSQPLKEDLRRLAVLIGIAAAIGIYLILTCVLIHSDGVFYIGEARRLADDPLAVARKYPIGYPLLLSAAHRVMGLGDSALAWVHSSQSLTLLTRLLALVPLYWLGKRLVGARRSFLALLVLIVLPDAAAYGSTVLREWPFLLFLVLGFWLLVCALQDQRGWLFGLVGLSAGLGYLIRPMSAQTIVYALIGLTVAYRAKDAGGVSKLLGAGALLTVGFAIPVAPYLVWTQKVVPSQLNPAWRNRAPDFVSIGGRSASGEPLQFHVAEGELLELPIEAHDLDGDSVTFSVVTVPVGGQPVYRLWSGAYREHFLTIREREKDTLLATHRPAIWDYDGMAYYAYPRSGATAGLRPVYRFWSPVLYRHFYTIRAAGREPVTEAPNLWQDEGIAFYAFPEGAQPPGAIPVYRFRDEAGRYSWGTKDLTTGGWVPSQDTAEPESIAWYACAASAPPAGSTLQDRTFRWRPASTQRGPYQLNIIATDGIQPRCRLVRIDVGPIQSGTDGQIGRASRAGLLSAGVSTGPLKVPSVFIDFIGAMGRNLRVFFLLPLCLGLHYRLRNEAGRYERPLILAVLALNVSLILARSLWIEPGTSRRYFLVLIVLTVFYIPSGLELMASGLAKCRPHGRHWPWFHILMAVGIATCLPKLLTPIGAGQEAERAAARWLRTHTESHHVVAVPNKRISFYADREGLRYEGRPDSLKADFIVTISRDGSPAANLEDRRQVYEHRFGAEGGKTLRIYGSPLKTGNTP